MLSTNPQAILHTSAIVPIQPDGTVPRGVHDQARTVWAAIAALLSDAGMAVTDIASVTTYVVASELESLPAVMAQRDAALGGRRVASTLVTVPALANAEWLIEISVVAVKAGG